MLPNHNGHVLKLTRQVISPFPGEECFPAKPAFWAGAGPRSAGAKARCVALGPGRFTPRERRGRGPVPPPPQGMLLLAGTGSKRHFWQALFSQVYCWRRVGATLLQPGRSNARPLRLEMML
ncbi:hypothetical protein MEBOL_006765 [Melittangium boletus DSM 14713]|uniref:Uncharacterized protein n=1 Tax=Melittangium boletus DSM 14713 TaxID=1294270 RepID=A0A250INF6_9BACT|nr:hypothetical protein MEBOL_006765 [Melittangium boletus DSM 14713]